VLIPIIEEQSLSKPYSNAIIVLNEKFIFSAAGNFQKPFPANGKLIFLFPAFERGVLPPGKINEFVFFCLVEGVKRDPRVVRAHQPRVSSHPIRQPAIDQKKRQKSPNQQPGHLGVPDRFPVFYGYSFYWGFFTYICSVPLGVFLLALTIRHARSPNGSNRALLALLSIVLFFSHILVFSLFSILYGALILVHARSFKDALKKILPYFAPAPLFFLWLKLTLLQLTTLFDSFSYGLSVSARLKLLLPSILTANTHDLTAGLVALGFFLFLFMGNEFKIRRTRQWTLPALVLILFLLIPANIHGFILTSARIPLIFLITLLIGLTPTRSIRFSLVSKAGVLILSFGWLFFLLFQWHTLFSVDQRNFLRLLNPLPEGQRVYLHIFHGGTKFGSKSTFHHFFSLIPLSKGGMPSWTFASGKYNYPLRYRPGIKPPGYRRRKKPLPLEKVLGYDYLIIRANPGQVEFFTDNNQGNFTETSRFGNWILMKHIRDGDTTEETVLRL